MDEADVARLEIYTVEEREEDSAICIVRCVGGVVRVGQRLALEPNVSLSPENPDLTLGSITRYEKRIDFIDPPHNAKVHLSGRAVDSLERGVIITAVTTNDLR